MKRCCSLQIKIGFSWFKISPSLSNVCCNNVFGVSEFIAKYCFGKLSLDKGQSLETFPPQRINGNKGSIFH